MQVTSFADLHGASSELVRSVGSFGYGFIHLVLNGRTLGLALWCHFRLGSGGVK